MFVYIDESGIHKPFGYSSFALVFVSVKKSDGFDRRILQIEEEIGSGRFHWASTDWKKREQFFERILDLDWNAKVGIVENPINPDEELERMISNLLTETKLTTIFIDGKKSRRYERRMKKVLRDKGISTKKLKTVNDEGYAGIRVADALAGLFRAYHDDKSRAMVGKWYVRIRKKKKILVLQ